MISETVGEISKGNCALDVAVIFGEEDRNRETWKSLCGQRSPPVTPLANRKGLQNRLGENNCFLNSIVQVLWHLDPFRENFLLVSGHACTEKSCIFCSLKVVFTQFQFSDHSTLPPDSLRRALAAAFAKRSRFQLGLMDDATECFEIILRWLHFHLVYKEPFDSCKAPHCISHSKFGMNITEQAFCILCGTKTRPLTFTELVHYVPTSAITQQSRASANGNRTCCFGRLLRNAVETEGRSCPAGCGEGLQMNQVLTNSPDVLTIGLIWNSDSATPNDIARLVMSIDNVLRPSDMFQSLLSVEFHLVGVVCYYHKHYSTFLYDRNENVWNLFDDATVVQVGPSWSVVAAKICVGRFQPLLLFYENPKSVPISMATALSRTHFVDAPVDFASFSLGDPTTDLALSLKRHVTDYEGGNPSEARRKSFSSTPDEADDLKENSSLPLTSFPVMVTHHSSSDSNISEDCELGRNSRVKVNSAVVSNSDWHSGIPSSIVPVTNGYDENQLTVVNRSGQQDYPLSFEESKPDHQGFFSDLKSRGHLNGPCIKPSAVTRLGYGGQADSPMKNGSVTVTQNTETDSDRCFLRLANWERSQLLPSAQIFPEHGSDFWDGRWHPAEMLRSKRSSFACSSQNSFTFDELSYYSCDDQFLSLGSRQTMNRSSSKRFPSSQGLFPRCSNGYSTPFGFDRISRNSQLIDEVEDTQESYINPETVMTVLRSRGLKLHSGLGSLGKKQDDATRSASSQSLSEQIKNVSVQLEVTHVTSQGNFGGCENSNEMSNATQPLSSSRSHTNTNACFTTAVNSTNRPETKRQQKGILMKRRQQKKKRVSFSDNVALVLCADDVPSTEPQSYVDYVRQIATQSRDLRSSSLSSTSSSDSSYSSSSDSTTGSLTSPLPDLPGSLIEGMSLVEVSRFAEEDDELDSEDDTCIPEEELDGNACSDKIRCNLCCRKWVVVPDVYCRDCNIYLNRLQHQM